MLVTALVFGGCAAHGRRRLRGAYPAPPEVCDLVRFAAQRMGLSRSPRVMLIDRRMSPMIWCGRRPMLVLPVDLWDELDDAGRHAVIFHELAHLLRRDHWVCRLSIAATCLYWWHPLVWWVRKRVHEEAEMCLRRLGDLALAVRTASLCGHIASRTKVLEWAIDANAGAVHERREQRETQIRKEIDHDHDATIQTASGFGECCIARCAVFGGLGGDARGFVPADSRTDRRVGPGFGTLGAQRSHRRDRRGCRTGGAACGDRAARGRVSQGG